MHMFLSLWFWTKGLFIYSQFPGSQRFCFCKLAPASLTNYSLKITKIFFNYIQFYVHLHPIVWDTPFQFPALPRDIKKSIVRLYICLNNVVTKEGDILAKAAGE